MRDSSTSLGMTKEGGRDDFQDVSTLRACPVRYTALPCNGIAA